MALAADNNFYKILGLKSSAPNEELRAAYLKLALKYHPDRNPSDKVAEERFKAISQAYAVLRDPQAKAKYDKLLAKKRAKAQKKAQTAPPSGAGPAQPRARNYQSAGTYAPFKSTQGQGTNPKEGPKGTSKPYATQVPPPVAKPKPSPKAQPNKSEAKPTPQKEPPKTTGRSKAPPPTQTGEARPLEPEPKGNNKGTFFNPGSTWTTKPLDETLYKADATRSAQSNKDPESMDPEEVILKFFTTPDGQVSLKKIQEELVKSGLKGNPAMFTKMEERVQPKGSFWEPMKNAVGKKLKGIKNALFSNPLTPVKPKLTQYDLTFNLALAPKAAQTGTKVELQYFQDGKDRKIAVQVPPKTKDNTRLRLSGQGNLKPNGQRGDLLLNITIPSKSDNFTGKPGT
ncbi:MAG: DnaJ domain-containing protein [Deltaproteobacteria bacterium]|jgi:curved DNA-binding protein CbpA|nr:DnaJ domain-containing protein [Deltaproteobacteria bacterium]